jgi:Calx-beta domain
VSHSLSTFLGRTFARRLDRELGAASRRNSTYRLRVESLEDRAVPAIFTVTDLGDNGGVDPSPGAGTGTLRQAIVDANATPADDQIEFDASLFGTAQPINLESSLTIAAAGGGLTISGPGADLLTVQRDSSAAAAFSVINSYSPDLSLSDFTISGGTAFAAGVYSAGTTNLDHITITGNNANDIAGGLFVTGGQTVNITNSVISGNSSTQAGGIQVNSGATLNLTDSIVSGNTATGAGGVGGILAFNGSTLNLKRTTVSNNSAPAGAGGGVVALGGSTINILDSAITGNSAKTYGGGVYIATGSTLLIQNSTISGNSVTGTAQFNDGGGVYVGGLGATAAYFSTATIIDSTISGNSAGYDGGGIYAGAFAKVTITNSTITGNTAVRSGGGVDVRSNNTLTVRNSTISGNTADVGGGIYFGFNGSLYMAGSTISGNKATTTGNGLGGGGLYFYGAAGTVAPPPFDNSVVIVNSTIANNTSSSSGGGILLSHFDGGLVMGNTTIVGNSAANTSTGEGGGGIAILNSTTAQLVMANSIVSGNTNINGPDILTDRLVDTQYSAIGSQTGFAETNGDHNLPLGVDLKLGPLADNGGPTQTMAPQFDPIPSQSSPLINAGINVYAYAVGPVDQIGSPHVRIFGSTVDIGAYEVQPPSVKIEQVVGQSDPTNGTITFDIDASVPLFTPTLTTLDASSFTITYGGTLDSSAVTLDLVQDPLDSAHYTLQINGLTGDGNVTVTLAAAATVDGSNTGNLVSTSTDNIVRFDDVAPTVTNVSVKAGQADPTNGAISFDVNFSEDMDFDFSNVHFALGAGLTGTPTGTVTVDPLDSTHYTVTVNGGLSGDGTLTASILTGAVTDLAGNATLADSGSAAVRFDNIAPIATINRDAGQADPSGGNSVSFNLTLSEPIQNPGGGAFDGSTITFTGSTATPIGANFTVQVTPIDSTHYTVTVGGVMTGGTIQINLPNGSFQDVAGNLNGTTVIGDNSVDFHPTGTLQFTQSAVTASEKGGADVTFTVSRTGATDGTLTVDYAVSGGTATGGDYTFTPGTLTFGPADLSKSFIVHVNDDQSSEGDETLDLTLSNTTYDNGSGAVPLGGILGTPTTETLTINDYEEGTFAFSSATYAGSEGGTDVSVVINRSGGTAGTATVDLTIAAGSANAADILGTALGTTTISFANGDTSKTITIHLEADGLSERDETILLSLSNPTPVNGAGGGAKLGTITTSVLTIAKNDPVVLNPANKFTKKFTDTDQDSVTVKLTGSKAGTVNVYLDNQTPASLKGPISLIDLVGTDATGTLSVTVTKAKKTVNPSADGVATIGGVSAPTLKSLNAGKINLDGAIGAGIQVVGSLGSITLGNVLNGADISTGAGAKSTKVTLGAVGNQSNVTIGNPISTFTATSFGDGTITANSATSITIKGNAKATPANPGDFGATVNLDGAGVLAGKPTLNVLKVAGSLLATADIDVTGKLGTVTVGTAKNSNTFAGSLTADAVTSITVNGNLTGNITVTGTGVAAGKPALGKLAVKGVGLVGGTVDGATIHVGDDTHIGNVTSITAVNFLNSEFFAGYAGAPNGSGAFNGVAGGTVGSFTVSDTYANSNAVANLFKKVSIKNVTTVNPTSFGLFAHAFTSIKITTPAITAPSNNPVGQFFVKVVV